MTKFILTALTALAIAVPTVAQAEYDCWPVRCATSQASTKPGLKKVEDKKEGEKKEKTKEGQQAEAKVDGDGKTTAK